MVLSIHTDTGFVRVNAFSDNRALCRFEGYLEMLLFIHFNRRSYLADEPKKN